MTDNEAGIGLRHAGSVNSQKAGLPRLKKVSIYLLGIIICQNPFNHMLFAHLFFQNVFLSSENQL
jgi:hypothetical protein